MQAALNSDDISIKRAAINLMISKIIVHADQIVTHISQTNVTLAINYHFSAPGKYTQLVENGKSTLASKNQAQAILKAYLQGTAWRRILISQSGMTIGKIAKTENITPSYITRLINFSMMAPDLVSRIIRGDVPRHVTREGLLYKWPMSWTKQRQRFA